MTAFQEFDAAQYRKSVAYRAVFQDIEALKRKLSLAQRDGRKARSVRIADKLEAKLFAAYAVVS